MWETYLMLTAINPGTRLHLSCALHRSGHVHLLYMQLLQVTCMHAPLPICILLTPCCHAWLELWLVASSASWVLSLCGALIGEERTLSGEVWCRWDTWGRLIASHTSSFPWAVIEGNHEEEVSFSAPTVEGFPCYQLSVAVWRHAMQLHKDVI